MSQDTPLRVPKIKVTLNGKENFREWEHEVDITLKSTKGCWITVQTINTAYMLDEDVFKKHKKFKQLYKDAGEDEEGNEVSAMEDEEFVELCREHAIDTGEGLKKWVPPLFKAVHDSIGEDVRKDTKGVDIPDLVGLLQAVRLSVHYTESFDPRELRSAYENHTMEASGNAMLSYTGDMASYVDRLYQCGVVVPFEEQKRNLLRGLNEEVFEHFSYSMESKGHHSIRHLLQDLNKYCARKQVATKLMALRPGGTHSTSHGSRQRAGHAPRKSAATRAPVRPGAANARAKGHSPGANSAGG